MTAETSGDHLPFALFFCNSSMCKDYWVYAWACKSRYTTIEYCCYKYKYKYKYKYYYYY